MYVDQCRAAIEHAANTLALDEAVKAIYRGIVANLLDDADADALQTLANARRMALGGPQAGSKPSGAPRPSIFPPRRPTPRYDRSAARQRRRAHSRDRWMPDHLADRFTDGELAALSVIAQEVLAHGVCNLPVAQIAAFAGVCERTARYALRAAEDMGIISIERVRPPGQKNLPNAIRIISREWSKWIERRPATWRGRIGCKSLQSSPRKKESSSLPPSFGARRNRRKGYQNGAAERDVPDDDARRMQNRGRSGPERAR